MTVIRAILGCLLEDGLGMLSAHCSANTMMLISLDASELEPSRRKDGLNTFLEGILPLNVGEEKR